jgi:hypothetical protein
MPGENILNEFVEELVKTIRFLRTGDKLLEPIYIDRERLKPGFTWKPELARALCRSRAMLAVYTADYFAREYCVREWDAMLDLEVKRLGRSTRGMIIPIILRAPTDRRGEPLLPDRLTGLQYEDFRSILAPKQQFTTVKVRKKISRLMDRIEDLRRHSRDPQIDCTTYNFKAKSPVLLPPQDPFAGWTS